MEDELTALQARICKVLAHPKRLQIVYALRAGERSVGELAKELQLPYANLSQHLRILLEIGAWSRSAITGAIAIIGSRPRRSPRRAISCARRCASA
jgi:DNA-binding transcriptional ArsR family regulator